MDDDTSYEDLLRRIGADPAPTDEELLAELTVQIDRILQGVGWQKFWTRVPLVATQTEESRLIDTYTRRTRATVERTMRLALGNQVPMEFEALLYIEKNYEGIRTTQFAGHLFHVRTDPTFTSECKALQRTLVRLAEERHKASTAAK